MSVGSSGRRGPHRVREPAAPGPMAGAPPGAGPAGVSCTEQWEPRMLCHLRTWPQTLAKPGGRFEENKGKGEAGLCACRRSPGGSGGSEHGMKVGLSSRRGCCTPGHSPKILGFGSLMHSSCGQQCVGGNCCHLPGAGGWQQV